MSAPKFPLPAEPLNGFTIEYWRIDLSSYFLATSKPQHGIATYYSYLKWEDHPWSASWPGSRGAPFEDAWAIEVDGSASGRTDGWHRIPEQLEAQSTVFATEAEAWAALRTRIINHLTKIGAEAEELRNRLAEIQGR